MCRELRQEGDKVIPVECGYTCLVAVRAPLICAIVFELVAKGRLGNRSEIRIVCIEACKMLSDVLFLFL